MYLQHLQNFVILIMHNESTIFLILASLDYLKGKNQMTELQEKILSAVQDAGGSTDWLGLMANLEFTEQQRALSEIRALETEGKLRRSIVWDAVQGTVSFTVETVG